MQWQSIADGANLNLLNDQQLIISVENNNSIVENKHITSTSPDEIKAHMISHASVLLQQYYLNHPLSDTGFNQQVKNLFDKHGIETFISNNEQAAERTFFVEGAEVIAENASSPRHPYGVYFTVENKKDFAPQQAINWVDSGEAYETYLSMNVCRYNC